MKNLFKNKASELSILTGDQIAVIAFDQYHGLIQTYFSEGKMTEIGANLTSIVNAAYKNQSKWITKTLWLYSVSTLY